MQTRPIKYDNTLKALNDINIFYEIPFFTYLIHFLETSFHSQTSEMYKSERDIYVLKSLHYLFVGYI